MTMNKSIILTYLAQVQNLSLKPVKLACTCASNPVLIPLPFLPTKSTIKLMALCKVAATIGIAPDVVYSVLKLNTGGLLRVFVNWHTGKVIIWNKPSPYISSQLPAKGEK